MVNRTSRETGPTPSPTTTTSPIRKASYREILRPGGELRTPRGARTESRQRSGGRPAAAAALGTQRAGAPAGQLIQSSRAGVRRAARALRARRRSEILLLAWLRDPTVSRLHRLFVQLGRRIIHLSDTPHLPKDIKLWNGDSRGHWEGNTLVVDVSNLNSKARFGRTQEFASENVHVVERYIFDNDGKHYNYVATFSDPTVFLVRGPPRFRRDATQSLIGPMSGTTR